MKKLIFLFGTLLWNTVPCTVSAQQVDYWRTDSVKVEHLLHQASLLPDTTNYMLFFARQLKGLPYVAKTLEKNDREKLIVNLRQMDCTTYVETVATLARCIKMNKLTFEDYCNHLKEIRYKDGKVDYPHRLHYFTYWIEDNLQKQIIVPVSQPRELFSAQQNVKADFMTTHTQLYPMLVKRPEWIQDIRKMEQQISGTSHVYIPKDRLEDSPELRQTIHDGDIIVILTNRKGLDTSHIGIAVWHKDGLHLLNASQLRHRVVEETKTFYQYMKEHPSFTGIRVIRLA